MTKTKQTRPVGRPAKTVSFKGFKNGFTIDSVLGRYHGSVSRATVYNKLQELLTARPKQAKEIARIPGSKQGHPTYKYALVA